VLTATKKRLLISESDDDSNRCTPYRGNLVHMTRMLLASVHVCHTCAFHGQSLYVVTFHADPTELDRFTAYEKKCSLLHLSARMGGLQDPSQFLYQHNHWSSVLKTNICWWTYYIDLLDPYHQHVINTFNIFSRGPTHRSLTDTDGGYNLGGAGLPHHTPRPSQPTVLRFPPKGPHPVSGCQSNNYQLN
jgi:hypothetical protein